MTEQEEYLTEEKFVPLSTTDEYFQVPDYGETYLFSAQGQTILLDSRYFTSSIRTFLFFLHFSSIIR